ncbi:MAG: DUF3224 domain-containing protein [Myxococcus sp.]|nr:DUF3224 domain-containing protein [Myxococcus sp.]
MPTLTGSFDVTMQAEPPYDTRDGVSLGRARFDKRFHGPLEATSVVHMLSARTPIPSSAAYVALERIEGTLDGKAGAFCVTHVGTMNRGADSLVISVVPDSGTGALTGLTGTMRIRVVDGKHLYELDYAL